jgi:hypothetical protein
LDAVTEFLGAGARRSEQFVATEPVHVDARTFDDALEQLPLLLENVSDALRYTSMTKSSSE